MQGGRRTPVPASAVVLTLVAKAAVARAVVAKAAVGAAALVALLAAGGADPIPVAAAGVAGAASAAESVPVGVAGTTSAAGAADSVQAPAATDSISTASEGTGGQPAAPVGRGVSRDTTVNVYGDTVTVLGGLTVVDIDSLLMAGEGVILAFEDTIPFAMDTLDTLFVDAPRATIDEVVRRIGERLEADLHAIEEHEFTARATVVARSHENPEREYTVHESATRMRRIRDGTWQWAEVWQREREFEDGELKKEKVKDEVEVDWAGMGNQLAMAVPFSLEGGNQYRYQILDRRLVGLNLVYKMHYEPRDPFAALASGTVWVDYSDWVIRRIDAEMVRSVPLPLVVKSIPVYKMRREQRGRHWVLADVYARVELRSVPLLGLPGTVEMHWRASDHVINGVRYEDGGADDEGVEDEEGADEADAGDGGEGTGVDDDVRETDDR
ncbi:MAG: hypothetical protein R6X25_15775 [Candidatus Krumholzibacteriia bacterium]